MTSDTRSVAALIFVHIPKTAGTTLNRLIEAEYPPHRIFSVEGTLVRWSLKRFKTLPDARLRGLRVVKGHMYYGLHEYLPQGGIYMTVLRDPVERVLSTYYYILENKFHPLRKRVLQEAGSLEAFVERMAGKANVMTKIIAGLDIDAAYDESTYESALSHLERDFVVVGLTERFPESLALMKAKFGWKMQSYRSFRQNRERPAREEVSQKILDRIAELNSMDVRLYRRGAELFERQIQSAGAERIAEIVDGFQQSTPTNRGGWLPSAKTTARALITKVCSTI